MIKDLTDWQNQAKKKNKKKHQWGWFQHPNAGNVEYNIDFFNHVSGADGGDTSVLAGDGGIGESLLEMNDLYELEYDDIEVEGYYGPIDWETGYRTKEYHDIVSWTLRKDKDDLWDYIADYYFTENPDVSDEEGYEFVDDHFKELFDKYYNKLLDAFRAEAEEQANEKYEFDEYGYYDESINIPECLNRMDYETCNKYDLLNTYNSRNFGNDEKRHIAEMLKSKSSAVKLYEYMNDEFDDDWRIGLELFEDGKSYKVISVLDARDVDDYELAIVGAIGDEASYAEEEVYFVLLDGDVEWGPVDTAEEAFEWASDVQDGYYSELDDNFEYDDEGPDFLDVYGAHGEYDDDYGVQKRHGDVKESMMSEIDLEIKNAGSVDAYADELEQELGTLSREISYLRNQAKREVNAGGAYDSAAEVDEAIDAAAEKYELASKKYRYIMSKYFNQHF